MFVLWHAYGVIWSSTGRKPFLGDAPLFTDERNRPFCREMFNLYLRHLMVHRLGYSQTDYCGHSFRIGAATTAAAVGIEDHMIKTLGRWKSSCYERYIHSDQSLVKEALQRLSATVKTSLVFVFFWCVFCSCCLLTSFLCIIITHYTDFSSFVLLYARLKNGTYYVTGYGVRPSVCP